MSQLDSYLQDLQRFGIKPGLERIRALLARVGNPQLEYPVVLIGGTNGKGSTCEFLARMLAQEGRRVGLYTSPHLYSWNERIRVLDGAISDELFPGIIPDADLDALLNEARPPLEAIAQEDSQPTEFEVLTFLGLWHFARQKVDVAVIEVGLGGKWDATNVCEPLVSVVTHVALDHCDRLGSTVEEIARDKVEIARPNRVLVTAEAEPKVLEIFRSHCEKIGAKLVGMHFKSSKNEHPLVHRAQNRLTAIAAHNEFLRAQGETPPQTRTEPVPTVPGRMETLRESPRVLLDGANNPDGAEYLAYELSKEQGFWNRNPPNSRPSGKNLILVLGISSDKDIAGMCQHLAPLAQVVITTQAKHPRAASAEVVAEAARPFCGHVEAVASVPEAVERARELAQADDVICITGSFFVLAEVERARIIAWPSPCE